MRGIHRSRWIPRTKPVTRRFDVFFDLRLNKQLSKQSWGWWFETPSRSLRHHCNVSLGYHSLDCITYYDVQYVSGVSYLDVVSDSHVIMLADPCRIEFIFRKHEIIFAFSIIMKTKQLIINTMDNNAVTWMWSRKFGCAKILWQWISKLKWCGRFFLYVCFAFHCVLYCWVVSEYIILTTCVRVISVLLPYYKIISL